MKLVKIFILTIISFFGYSSFASHIVGGEFTYQYLGGDSYLLRLKVYRDCINGIPPFDDPATIVFFDSKNVLLGYNFLTNPSVRELPIVSTDPCIGTPSGVCVQEAVYLRQVSLPYREGGYQLSYQRCCRNKTIVNIVDPAFTGATYTLKIPDQKLLLNSSPFFNNFPPIYICNNVPLIFDHSATDPDGDSLAYELCDPFVGGDSTLPANGFYSNNVFYYTNNVRPPYDFVTFRPPFSGNNPLSGVPLRINSKTGLLTATPNRLGQFVVGICVNEYRKGKLVGSTKRDFQFNVTTCPPAPTASIPQRKVVCGLTAYFKNLSINARTFQWDFGDTSTINDISNLENPSYTYPRTGIYNISLIVNNNTICADTAYGEVVVYNAITGANFTGTNVCLNQLAQFNDLSSLSEGTVQSWQWNFGDNSQSDQKNPSHQFAKADTFQVKLIVKNENTCADSIIKPIVVYPLPPIKASNDTLVCLGQDFKLKASGAEAYIWNGPRLSCYGCTEPKSTALATEIYSVRGISNLGCSDLDTVRLTVPVIVASAGNDTIVCNKSEVYLKGNGSNFFKWFPSGTVKCITCPKTIATPITTQRYFLETSDINGCKDTSDVLIRVRDTVPINAGLDQKICFGTSAVLFGVGGISRTWIPENKVVCATCNPVTTFPLFKDAKFILEVKDIYNCTNTDSINVTVYSNSAFAGNDTTICFGTQANLIGRGGVFYQWKGYTQECLTCNRLIVSPNDTTQYIYRSRDQYNCINEDTVQVNVRRIIPVVDFNFNEPRCFDVPINFNGRVTNFDFLCLSKIKYLWDFGDGTKDTIQNPTHLYGTSGDFTVTLDVNGTIASTKKLISLLPKDSCLKNVYVPNTFTPNGDGQNDILYVRGINVIKLIFRLYNNWGEEVFSTSNLQNGWDGTYKGSKLSPQVFVYTGLATFWDGTEVVLEGNITLVE